MAFLRRLFCDHKSRQQIVRRTQRIGWTGTTSEAWCLDCGKELR